MIVVFRDDQFLGYGVSGVARLDVARYFDAPSAQNAGFDFRDRISHLQRQAAAVVLDH